MKKLLFIASVGLLFSCSNGAGTCVCTVTVTGSDVIPTEATMQSGTGEKYYENDAQEYCDADQNQYNETDNYFNNNWQAAGIDAYRSTSCVVE